jgi:hypothetical protein
MREPKPDTRLLARYSTTFARAVFAISEDRCRWLETHVTEIIRIGDGVSALILSPRPVLRTSTLHSPVIAAARLTIAGDPVEVPLHEINLAR